MEGPKVFITSEEIQDRVRELAVSISRDYEGKNPLLITLLKGAFIFLADLVRNMTITHEVDFITFSSYRDGSRRCEAVEIVNHLRSDIEGRNIIIIDEIIDTGHTLSHLVETLTSHQIMSLKICTLLDKRSTRQIDVPVDYCGFRIPDVFVVGYGLDYRERFRNLLYITELTEEFKRLEDPPPDFEKFGVMWRIAPAPGPVPGPPATGTPIPRVAKELRGG